jgi:hypothetical protein
MKYYTFGEILYALRKEYLKAYSILNEVKDEIGTRYDPDNVYLDIVKSLATDKFDLSFVYDTHEGHKSGDRTFTEIGTLYDSKEEDFINRDFIWVKNKKKVLDIIKELDNTEFGNNMHIPDLQNFNDINNPDNENSLILWANHLEYCIQGDKGTYRGVYYRPYEDKIYIERDGLFQKVNDQFVIDSLNQKLPEYLLGYYHKDLIEASSPKEVIVDNHKINTKCNKYGFEEEGKRLVLKR